jgi:hypothetical protein
VTPPDRASLLPAVSIAVIVTCLAALTWELWPIHGLVFQVCALMALLAAFRACPPIARWLAGTPIAHRAVCYVLLAAVAAGHFSLSTRRWYPFVAWDIFSSVSEQETVFCRELIGTTESQKQVRLLVEQLYPSIIQFDLPLSDQPANLDLLVAAMAKTYDAGHPADPLRHIDLMLMAVKLHPPLTQTRSQPSCELLQRFDLSSGPSS